MVEKERCGIVSDDIKNVVSFKNASSASHESHQSPAGDAEVVNASQMSHNHVTVTPDTPNKQKKESKVSEEIALTLREKLTYDELQGAWYSYQEKIWKEVPDRTARRIIKKKLSVVYKDGFNLAFLRNIEGFMQMDLCFDTWQTDKNLLPMQNGILNLTDKSIIPHSFTHRFKWCLPFEYNPESKCPTIMDWLKTSTDDDYAAIETIRCCFYLALIGSKNIQKFMELVGVGGTGKSTLTRLLTMLVGEENKAATDLKNLENNRFESSTFYGKRLVLISDSSRYGGEVSALKAITGGDPIRFEKKQQQQGASFIAECFVVIASNESIQSSDYSSGLTRRRIPVNFNRRVTEEDKARWKDQGGIELAMQKELPGLLNWVLELNEDEVNKALGGLNGAMTMPMLEHYVATNKLAAWLEDRCVVDESKSIYTGARFKGRDEEINNDIRTKLYPNYQDWCEEMGVKVLAVTRFGDALADVCGYLKLPVKREPKDRNDRRFTGLNIRSPQYNNTPTPVLKLNL